MPEGRQGRPVRIILHRNLHVSTCMGITEFKWTRIEARKRGAVRPCLLVQGLQEGRAGVAQMPIYWQARVLILWHACAVRVSCWGPVPGKVKIKWGYEDEMRPGLPLPFPHMKLPTFWRFIGSVGKKDVGSL
jgi:hypothetical protein